ncbi:hypothetical protein, partial [Arcobacter sp.]|uniref:hypothetical protein n=1 Tax=Arcobacter sp. TaxID=1872629 RepID=UPI003D09B44C
MYDFIKNYKFSIGYILFKKVYLTYFIILIFFMIYQIFSQYDNIKNETFTQFKKVESVYKELLTKHIIEKNIFALDNITKTIFATTNISGISVISDSNNFGFFKGTISDKLSKYVQKIHNDVNFYDDIDLINNVNFYNEKELMIDKIQIKKFNKTATITFYIKNSAIYNKVWNSILLILINMGLSMIVLWVLFVIFTGKYLIKPLNTIIDATNRFDIEEHEVVEIDLDSLQKNELYKLSKVFNTMSKRINEAYINMEQLSMIKEIQKNKLEDQKAELIQANKSKDDFLANMSHELKTPLNS